MPSSIALRFFGTVFALRMHLLRTGDDGGEEEPLPRPRPRCIPNSNPSAVVVGLPVAVAARLKDQSESD